MVLFLWGGFELKKYHTDQGDCTYLVKSAVPLCVTFLWNSCVLYPSFAIYESIPNWCVVWAYISWLHKWNGQCQKNDKKLRFLLGCAKPEPHPTVPLYCKYLKYSQLFWAVELDTGLEVYSWSSNAIVRKLEVLAALMRVWFCQLRSCY